MKKIKFSPSKKQHVGEFIVKVTFRIDSQKLNITMSYRIVLNVLDVPQTPPPPETLGERVRFYISKIT